MTHRAISARFEDFDGHRSVVVRWTPAGNAKAQVLFVPAFGDEMNQMRRMVRLAAESLVERGIASSVFDLYGTGDSSADFSAATIERWQLDCLAMIERLRTDSAVPLILIGCRLGFALSVRVTQALSTPVSAVVGWAPLLQGKSQLSGMLRAAGIARTQRAGMQEPDARVLWAAGEAATLGGYPVSPQLAHGLETLTCSDAPRAAQVVLLDVRIPIVETAPEPSKALRDRAMEWTRQGTPTRARAVSGAGFWNVADLVDIPELIDRTVEEVARLV